jgi:hypothetical protein
MDRLEPDVRDGRSEDWIGLLRPILEPSQEARHFRRHAVGRRPLEMNLLPVGRARDDLHGTARIGAPGARGDRIQASLTGRKQHPMPPKQAFGGECLIEVAVSHR